MLGAPGSGKGTQANILSQLFNIDNISTGEMFRTHFKNNTDLGIMAKNYINKGLLVPDEITNKMIVNLLSQKKTNQGFLLDGFPRNLLQAKLLKSFFKQKKIILTAIIYLNTSEECLQKRITGRRICPKCDSIYHLETKPPKFFLLCDKDKTPLIQRKDDEKQTFLKRLTIYKKETFPLIKYYSNMSIFSEIKVNDMKTSIKQVTNLILQFLKKS